MKLLYTIFLNDKYLKKTTLESLRKFADVYKLQYQQPITEKEKKRIEEEVLGRELSCKQRTVDTFLLSKPNIMKSYINSEYKEIKAMADKRNLFYELAESDQVIMLEYLFHILYREERSEFWCHIMHQRKLDLEYLPDNYLNKTEEELRSIIDKWITNFF